jgi:hypothetical protein
MKRVALCFGLIALLLIGSAMAATEEAKQLSIDNGLAWLASTQVTSGAEGYWPYSNNGTIAATGSAVLAFLEEGYLPGDGSIYDDVVTKAVTYIFNRATVDGRFGVETAGYEHYAEDYSNNGAPYDEGNDEAIYFEPGASTRRVYTTGIVAPVVYALGNALGTGTVVGIGSAAISGKTYAQAMQDIVDWFSWGQVEPNRGNFRGGWRYDANYSDSDNSTAQWGSLPLLYAADWGLGVPQYVFDELERWVNYIQNTNGGSGYSTPTNYVNVSKTGGLLLELAAIGAPVGDPRVVAALGFIDSRWNTGPSGTWYGNLNHPYAMWAVYKGLQVYGFLSFFDCGPKNILIGTGMPAAPGGFSICFDAAPTTSAASDWYSHYCDYLVGIQNGNGSWSGYWYWTGPLATGWYINILNAVRFGLDIALDIKPRSCPNPLNAKLFEDPPMNARSMKGGVLPVAILGSGNFDVNDIDVSTLLLEGVEPLRSNLEDVSAPLQNGEECECTTDGPDGFTDLTLKFRTSEIAAAIGPCTDDEVIALTLTGALLDGTPFDVSDCVRILSKRPELPSFAPESEVILKPTVPNPFNPVTKLAYTLPRSAHVRLAIYDVRGRLVETLTDGVQAAGEHVIEWDAGDLASGVYYYRLESGDVTLVRQAILLK